MEKEDYWKLRLGISLWMRRLSWMKRSKELSVLLNVENYLMCEHEMFVLCDPK